VSVLLGNGDGTFAAQATRQAALPQPQAPGRSPIGQGKATLQGWEEQGVKQALLLRFTYFT